MMIEFKVIHLPMTATEKFGEALYFFKCMRETVNNVKTFPYNLSAFLSALRSITFYLKKQFERKDERFSEWDQEKQAEMKDDPLLKMLVNIRNETVHEKPIEMLVRSGPRLPEEGIETTQFEAILGNDDDGNILVRYKVGRDAPEVQAEPITQWVFESPEERDVLEACAYGLGKLQNILEEWQQISQSL